MCFSTYVAHMSVGPSQRAASLMQKLLGADSFGIRFRGITGTQPDPVQSLLLIPDFATKRVFLVFGRRSRGC